MTLALFALAGCSEFVLREPPNVAPADPPPDDPDADFGEPPDWSTCSAGWFGQYFNLPSDHPDLEPDRDGADTAAPALPATPDGLDWWDADRLAHRRYDASLDAGANWWPVDEGLEGDPAYFAGRWTAWLRVTGGGTMDVVLGAETVAWLSVNHQVVARADDTADEGLQSTRVIVPVTTGQFPVELRFGQLRAATSGLRFRIAGGDVQLCYPDFSAP
ncbi:MAG: hypothetical protein ACK4YP_06000 [Myxococcota bacterium]